MTSSPYAERVLISELWRHREFDRSVPSSPAHPGGHTKTARQLAELAASIARDGILEPLILHYDPLTRYALLGEGNHRIWLAREAGHPDVPLIGVHAQPGYLRRRAGPEHAVDGEPRLRPVEPHGYFPAAFRPSLVLPLRYFARTPVPHVPFVDYEPGLADRQAAGKWR